jgi:hypothetical protein
MQFLKALLKALKKSSPNKSKASEVGDSEVVGRFAYQKSDFFKDPLKTKPKLFMPMQENGVWETSVCRVGDIQTERMWTIGDTVRKPKMAIGVSKLDVQQILQAGLTAKAAPEPNYIEHAVILGWPDEKEKQMGFAIVLAVNSEFEIHP